MNNAAVAGAVGAAGPMNDDAVAHLQTVLQQVPSSEALPLLTGPALMNHANHNPTTTLFATLYVQCVTRHLPVHVDAQTAAQVAAATGNVRHSSGSGLLAPQPSIADNSGSSSNNNNSLNNETAQLMQQSIENEIIQILALVAPHCQPPSLLEEVLPTLQRLWPDNNNNNNSSNNSTSLLSTGAALTPLQPDLLQIFLAANNNNNSTAVVPSLLLNDTWPRPARGSRVVTVLRYFYLRGLVHLQQNENNDNNNNNMAWAQRCFQTCLTIPADVVSALTVASWKKLLLLHCLEHSRQQPLGLAKLPKTTPTCVARYLNQAMQPASSTSSSGNNNNNRGTAGGADGGGGGVIFGGEPEDVMAIGGGIGGGGGTGATTTLTLVHQDELAKANACAMIATTTTATNNNHNTAQQPPAAAAVDASGVGSYAALARAFGKVDKTAFQAVLQQDAAVFFQDGNAALVQWVEQEFARRQVYHWSRVFSTISLPQLAQRTGNSVDETRRLLASMATTTTTNDVTVRGDMVHLPQLEPTGRHDDRSNNNNDAMMQDVAQLTKMIRNMDASLSTSSKFLSLLRKESPASSAPISDATMGRVEDL